VEAGTAPTLQFVSWEPRILTVRPGNGEYEATIDLTEMPELTDYAEKRLAPMIDTWYPRIVAMLPSEGFTAPSKVKIQLAKHMRGVADTAGTRIRCAGPWFRENLDGEAVGAVFHELVHVVQGYGRVRRAPGAENPGWLVEGIADYLRFYLLEPATRGADISPDRADRVQYNQSYRVTANFLNWVVQNRNKEVVSKLNVALRQGTYKKELWGSLTGSAPEELNTQWKASLKTANANGGDRP